MFETIAFYVFSLLTIASFIVVVTSKQAVYSMSALALGMILIAGFFFILDADFLGVVQVIVYSGAVMALYAFGMMFFDSSKDVIEPSTKPWIPKVLAAVSVLIVIGMVAVPLASNNLTPDSTWVNGMSNPQSLGVLLFTEYLLAFELASLMLLVAMICGIVLASKKLGDIYIHQTDDALDKAKSLKDLEIELAKEQK